MLQLHRFMIAVARVTVHHDGRRGNAPDPLVWDLEVRERRAGPTFLPLYLVLLVFWMGLGCRYTGGEGGRITGVDNAA